MSWDFLSIQSNPTVLVLSRIQFTLRKSSRVEMTRQPLGLVSKDLNREPGSLWCVTKSSRFSVKSSQKFHMSLFSVPNSSQKLTEKRAQPTETETLHHHHTGRLELSNVLTQYVYKNYLLYIYVPTKRRKKWLSTCVLYNLISSVWSKQLAWFYRLYGKRSSIQASKN